MSVELEIRFDSFIHSYEFHLNDITITSHIISYHIIATRTVRVSYRDVLHLPFRPVGKLLLDEIEGSVHVDFLFYI